MTDPALNLDLDSLKTIQDWKAQVFSGSVTIVQALQALERETIEEAMISVAGDYDACAKKLGIKKPTLYYRLKKYQSRD